ncbi:MAG: hypothetical protein K2H01_04715 [Ruminococcus sp.]|nr:hypothetical protein [Ruminococcus sp.]
MPKPRIPNQRKANIEHKKRIERYCALIQQVYDKIAQESARFASLAGADPDKPFSFADYPLTKEAIKKLQSKLISEVGAIIMSGTSDEWKESNLVQDLVAKKVLKAFTGTNKFGEEFTRYFQTNQDALKAFQQRKDEGMNLSTRVWNLSDQYKSELEESITAAIAPGIPAMELAAQVKKYLKDPDKRFRRVKEKMEDGAIKWHLSKNAKAYHPGQGVYRSSSRNAQRLARTEINMAYRTAEQERWKQFDFVVGYEVKTTQNGHHIEDICDQLAGKYPKDFKFVGWHPQCMCYCIPILKTEDEFWSLDDAKSINEITELPSNFREWINDNRERIETAEERAKLPYFIRDNMDEVENILNTKKRKKMPLEIPVERHSSRVHDDLERIQRDWDSQNLSNKISEVLNIAESVGSSVQNIAISIAELYDAFVTPLNIKSKESIKRKCIKESVSPNQLKDIVRTTIIAPRESIEEILSSLSTHPNFIRLKRQLPEYFDGYSGNIVNLNTSNGLVAEIQVNTPKMIYAKESPEIAKRILGEKLWHEIHKETGLAGGLGHKLYEQIRVLDKISDQEKRTRLVKQSIEYYSHFID